MYICSFDGVSKASGRQVWLGTTISQMSGLNLVGVRFVLDRQRFETDLERECSSCWRFRTNLSGEPADVPHEELPGVPLADETAR
jgi:hypothetical protein